MKEIKEIKEVQEEVQEEVLVRMEFHVGIKFSMSV
jgi:hypothetical protein